MPKASMNKYDRPEPREHEVGRTWQLLLVQTISQPQPEKGLPEQYLGPRIPGLNVGHAPSALIGRQNVHLLCTEDGSDKTSNLHS
jgi:hypothetical protein